MDLSFLSQAQRLVADDIIRECAISRIWFIENVLGVEKIEDWQREELAALDNGCTKLSIRSGHGVGKTTFCSWLALHFLLFRDDVKIIVTSPSSKQLDDGLIPEIQKWVNKLPSWMSRQLSITSERMTRMPNTANNFISFRTARKENPEALAGVHATHVLIIVDEASGVDEVIYETGQGALSTEGAIAVLIGNPTRPNGFFFKTHTTLQHIWRTRKVSCYDSSRVTQEYIQTCIDTYGLDSREFSVRVLGDFPAAGADAVIPRAYVESAVGRDVQDQPNAEHVWGLDVGRGGDPSGFIDRTARVIHHMEELRYIDTMRVVGWVKERYDTTLLRDRPKAIYVDTIGLGAGVHDRLRELGLPVVGVNVSETASMKERYSNLRAEIWYKTREWFEKMDVAILKHKLAVQLTDELSAPQQIIMSNGKIAVESKDDMKKRGLKSPNLADALNMTFSRGGAIQAGIGVGFGSFKVPDTLSYRAPGFR